MRVRRLTTAVLAVSLLFGQTSYAAEPVLIAIGSVNGLYEDFATQTSAALANGVPGNRLGGIGSGLAYLGCRPRRSAHGRAARGTSRLPDKLR